MSRSYGKAYELGPWSETKDFYIRLNEGGSVAIHFGGDPKQVSIIPVAPGWNYVVGIYRPRKDILDGTWKFPAPVETP